MKSWIRYSVAVYMGLLIAGSLMPPRASHSMSDRQMASVETYSENTRPDTLVPSSGRDFERVEPAGPAGATTGDEAHLSMRS